MIWIETMSAPPEPVTLEEAKGYLRIERSDEDALLRMLIRAARETVERETGRVLGRRGFRLALELQAGELEARVSRRPIASVGKVVAYDADGTPTEFEPASVAIRPGVFETVLRFDALVVQAGANGIEIEGEAGADDVPESLRIAVLRLVASGYEMRGGVDPAMQPAAIPPLVRGLLAPYRRMGL